MKILIIEDNERILDLLETYLSQNNFCVEVESDGELGFEKAKNENYDLVLLDLMLPNRTGFEIITGLRTLRVKTPILVISARDMVGDRIKALDLGADDYLVKDFDLKELVARAKTLIRRSSGKIHNVFRCRNLSLDITNMIARRSSKLIKLTRTEFRVLEILIRNKNKVVPSEDLMKTIWGESAGDSISNKLHVHIRLLRGKVDDPYEQHLIKTIRGFGYMITDLD